MVLFLINFVEYNVQGGNDYAAKMVNEQLHFKRIYRLDSTPPSESPQDEAEDFTFSGNWRYEATELLIVIRLGMQKSFC